MSSSGIPLMSKRRSSTKSGDRLKRKVSTFGVVTPIKGPETVKTPESQVSYSSISVSSPPLIAPAPSVSVITPSTAPSPILIQLPTSDVSDDCEDKFPCEEVSPAAPVAPLSLEIRPATLHVEDRLSPMRTHAPGVVLPTPKALTPKEVVSPSHVDRPEPIKSLAIITHQKFPLGAKASDSSGVAQAPGIPKSHTSSKYHTLPVPPQSPPQHMLAQVSPPRVMKHPEVKKSESVARSLEIPPPLPVFGQVVASDSRPHPRPPTPQQMAVPQRHLEVPHIDVRPVGMHPASPKVVPPPPGLQTQSFAQVLTQPPAQTPQAPTRPNYATMTPEQKAGMRMKFNFKFDSLREAYPAWKIESPPADADLDQIHDVYEDYVKKIMIALNSSQWKVYLLLMFVGIEVFGIKVLGLDFRGYTMSQYRLMSRYDRLLIELGERYYIQGASQWSIETRFFVMAATSAAVFIFAKYLAKWLGGDAMAEQIQGAIESLLGQGPMFSGQSAQRDEHGIPVVPGQEAAEAAKAEASSSAGPSGGFDLSALLSSFGSMMGGKGSGSGSGIDVGGLVANLGSALTKNMTPSALGAGPTTSGDKGSVDVSVAKRAAERRRQAYAS